MKTLMVTAAAALLLCASTASFAQDGPVVLGPATYQDDSPLPAPPVGEPMMEPIPAYPVEMVSLFNCVKVKDPNHIHPCAVPTIVQIADPCPRCNSGCDPCNPCAQCCEAPCVNVQICVPPCGCPKIKTRRDGHYVKYDYGRYRIEITSRNGVVTVDYDN